MKPILIVLAAVLLCWLLAAPGCAAAVRECPKGGCTDGAGMQRLADGFYKGEWRAGKFHGAGERVWTRPGEPLRRYVGGWRKGEPHGKGTWYRGQTVEFSGYSCRGSRLGPCGQGDCVNGSGTLSGFGGSPFNTYRGQFRDGLPDGQGQIVGHKWQYTGAWKDCVAHGPGKETREVDGVVLEGQWVDGEAAGMFRISQVAGGRAVWAGYYCTIGPKSLYLSGRCPSGGLGGCRDSVCRQGDCLNGQGVLEGRIDNERATFTGTFQDGLLHGEFRIAVGSEKPFAGRFDRCAPVPARR